MMISVEEKRWGGAASAALGTAALDAPAPEAPALRPSAPRTDTLTMRKPFTPALLALLIALLFPPCAHAVSWHWALSPDRYKKMNTFERAQYDKAAHLLETSQFAAAASEFEKFKVQFGDSPNLSYALFMRGYCLHQDKQRSAAIKAYQEVIDYFADQVDDASAALYHEGVAHFENGDTAKGVRCMKQLLESPLYKKTPLAAGALRRLADTYWMEKNTEEAVTLWRQAVKEFAHTNDEEYTAALSNLTAWYIISKDYVSYENLLLDDAAKQQDAQQHRVVADGVFWRAYNMYLGTFDRLTPINDKDLAAERAALYAYFSGTKPWWEKANALNDYYYRALFILARFHTDKTERSKVLTEALTSLRQLKDKTAADLLIAQLCDVMRQGQLADQARICVAAMTDRINAAWKEHEILCDESKWKEALSMLDQVEASTTGNWAARALWQRASIHARLGEYDKAIALYERVNEPAPPEPQWQIASLYYRAGKLDMAVKTLTEIENLFPDWGSRAIWQKACYYQAAKDKTHAVAQCHRLLKLYPKASEVPAAHALLVSYGELNFGGKADAK